MIARFEQKKIQSSAGVYVSRYKGLVNLPHWHSEHELVYSAQGAAEVLAGEEIYALNEGGCIFISGEETHYISSPPDSEIWVMKIDQSLVSEITGHSRLSSPMTEKCYPAKDTFMRISEELESGDAYSGIIAGSLARILTAEIFRGEKTEPLRMRSGDLNQRYKELIGIISKRYDTISFDEAAELMNLSRPYFSKYFRRMSGMTFTRYVNIVRVSEAAKMLSEGGVTVTEAAGSCGFGTIRSFNRVFRELTGFSPSALPEDYIFISGSSEDDGFDPTLASTVMI